ncbi:unnamed protein product, partial [Rotaria sp. Silwood2]
MAGQLPTPTAGNAMHRFINPPRTQPSSQPAGAVHSTLMDMSRSPARLAFQTPLPLQSTFIPRITESKTNAEKFLSDIIARYCNQNEYVSVEKVVENLFKIYKVTEWSHLNINHVNNPYKDLTPLSNLVLKHATVNLFVDVFKHIRIIGTLPELDQEISHHFKIDSYDKLNLGPILKHPKIITLFNLHDVPIIRPTTSIKIIELFYDYTRTVKYNETVDFDAFKDHAAESFGVETWTHLGVYAKSFPYILQTCRAMKKNLRTQNSTWSEKIEEIEIELCKKKLENIKNDFENALCDDNRQIYISKTPVDVFHHLLETVEEKMVFGNINDQDYLLKLLNELKNSELYKYLMNLAIYLGTIEEPKKFTVNMDSDQSNEQTSLLSSSPVTTGSNNKILQQQQPKVPLNKLCTTLYKLINESDGLFQMLTLIEIQREICQHYKIDEKNDFTLLGYGDFIKFLYDHKKTIGDTLEFYLFNSDSCGGIKRTELFTFVQHLFNNSINDKKIIEKTIKYHFNLQNSKQIGFHNIEQLCDRVQQQKQIQKTITTIQYEEILLGNEYLNKLDTNIHRPFIRDDDRLCEYLTNCPLLVDIKSWSHWNRLYMQDKGHIKEFLHRNKSKLPNLLCLEVSHNNIQFIRLSDTSNTENFEKDLMQMHLKEAAAHLLSLAIQERDCTRLPIARLQTIMKQWFDELKQSDINHRSSHYAIEQILNFLSFLPFPFSSSLVQKLILEPAEHLFRNFKSIIWKLANNNLIRKLHLEELGLTLGIDEWTQDLYNEATYLSENVLNTTSNETITNMESYQEQNVTKENRPIERSNNIVYAPKKGNSTAFSRPVRNDDINNSNNNDIEPFEHIKEIRKTLGKNTDLNNEDQEVVDNLQDLLGECLKKLADDLYSDQGHFVLELIQNADDNDYSKLSNNSIPKLIFIINEKQITIYNNENGFQKQHIKAICAVGKSTKDQYEPVIESYDNDIWTTCIRLNLKTDEHIQEQIKQKFDNISPKLLLFLHRLKSLEVNYEDHIKTFTRYDHPKNIIELTEFDGICEQRNYWLVIKKSLSIPETLQQKLREIKSNVVSTSVAIGFPLQYMEQCLRTNTPVPIQHLFAYLPVRQFGFRFILQADFEIPASRQDILKGNEWNEWLRDEMAQLLPNAYDYFTDLPSILKSISSSSSYFQTIDSIQAFKYFLKFIPVTNEVDPYFHGFIEHCLTELRTKMKFPTRKDNSQHEVEWQLPSKCVIVRDPFILKILSSNLLSKYCGKYFLHEYLHDVDEKILSLLGIEKLNIHEIIKIIKEQFLNQQQSSTSSIEQIAQWLICLNYSLEQMKYLSYSDDDTIQLKELKMIPIENQTELVSTNEMTIFFPDTTQMNSTEIDRKLIKLLNDLPTVKIELFHYIEQNYIDRLQEIKELLKKFGIIEKCYDEIYRLLIKPVFENEIMWKAKDSETLMMYLLYVYEHIHQRGYPNEKDFDIDNFKNIVQIKCQNNEFYNPMKTTIHLSTTDAFNDRISKLLKNSNCIFISDDYSNYIKHQEKNQWHMFLEKLGISEFLKIETVLHNQLRGTQWEHYEEDIRKDFANASEYVINDFTCNEFIEIFRNSENQCSEHSTLYHETCHQLLSYINRKWDKIRHYCRVNIFLVNNPYPLKEVDSTFCISLKQCNWISTKCIEYIYNEQTKEITKTETTKLKQPSNVFIQNADSYTVLRLLEYINNSTYIALSNIDISHTNEDDKKEKINTLLDNPPQPPYRRKFIESISTMTRLYQFLYDELSNDNRYMEWPLVFVPDSPSSEKTDLCAGHFLFINEVAWDDSTHLLPEHNFIKALYPDLETFFKHVLQIPSIPNVKCYIGLLEKYSKENITDQQTENVWKIFENLNDEDNDSIIKLFRHRSLIPSMTKCEWIKLDDEPYIPDDKIVAQLFELERLPIIKLPEYGLTTNGRKFLDKLQCKNFSEVLKSNVNVTNEKLFDDVQQFYIKTLPFVSNYLYNETDMFDESYDKRKLREIFLQMKFFSVDSVQVTYRYKHISFDHDYHCYLDEKSKKF